MLTLEQAKKILGDKAKNYTDEQLETMRDELYIAANLAFNHWQKSHCLTSEDAVPASLEVSQRLTSTPLPAGESADEK